jgi:Putative cyclase
VNEEEKTTTRVGTTPEVQKWLASYLMANRSWDRWGPADQRGAANLITPEKRRAAFHAVRTGQAVSLSRPVTTVTSAIGHVSNEVYRSPQFGAAVMRTAEDAVEIRHHGSTITHLDALCHVWLDGVGMWNGRDPDKEIVPSGATWGDVAQWSDGLVGRAVLLDVPGFRGESWVEIGRPVTAEELAAVVAHQHTVIEPGDMIAVYSGRDRYESATIPERAYQWIDGARPGLDPSCVRFLKEADAAVLLWDMMESEALSVHGVLWAFGVALVDNADMSRLVPLCREAGRYEFCLTIAPLNFPGATGCAVNPIAVL